MAATIELNNLLFPAVVAGDAVARDMMIVENVALVVVKADSFIKLMPSTAHLRDDLISAGTVGLVLAVNKVARGKVKSPRALNTYLGRSVTREMMALLPHERPIHVPKRSSAVARNPGSVAWNVQPIEMPVVTNGLPESLQAPSQSAIVDLQDVFAVCCQTDRERECLRLRGEGYTLVEISEQLSISRSRAQRTLLQLRTRIYSYLDTP